jgi:hypothetical protein
MKNQIPVDSSFLLNWPLADSVTNLKKWDIETNEKSSAKRGVLVHPRRIIVVVFIAQDILFVQDIDDAAPTVFKLHKHFWVERP